MLRSSLAALAAALTMAAPGFAQRTSKPAAAHVSTAFTCKSDLGTGVKSRRRFCDVLVSTQAADGVRVAIPAHRGTATLRFDLHNRFLTPVPGTPVSQGFSRNTAVVAVIRATGEVIERAAAVSEFRTLADAFDQIAGTGPGGVKAIVPGRAEPIAIAIPAGVSSVSIVGVSLDVLTRAGRQFFETPGRPVGIVSNVRIEY